MNLKQQAYFFHATSCEQCRPLLVTERGYACYQCQEGWHLYHDALSSLEEPFSSAWGDNLGANYQYYLLDKSETVTDAVGNLVAMGNDLHEQTLAASKLSDNQHFQRALGHLEVYLNAVETIADSLKEKA